MPVDASALLTDLYQLTMLLGYFDRGMEDTAVFELFVRSLPPQRGFVVAAGLEQALDYLENLRVTPEELDWLASTGRFRQDFLDYLGRLRFTGDVHAMPEGTLFFASEPIPTAAGPTGGEPVAQYLALPDHDRFKSGPHGAGSAGEGVD
jgi:nicotinate phosphoribosyltransferase